MKSVKASAFGSFLFLAVVGASSLGGCSSEGTGTPFTPTTTNSPSEPSNPGPDEPSDKPSEGDEGGEKDASAPGDCKRAAPSNVCGVSPQCGCAADETCDVVDSRGVARCVAAGVQPMGFPCESTQSCAQGLTCLFGICHAFCSNPESACTAPRTGACAQIKTTDGVDVPNLAICRVACDLHDPMSCGGASAAGTGVCRVDAQGETECQAGGARAEDEACTPEDDCGPGLACTNSTAGSICKRWCRVGQDDCGAKKCVGFKNEVNVRGVAYGACS